MPAIDPGWPISTITTDIDHTGNSRARARSPLAYASRIGPPEIEEATLLGLTITFLLIALVAGLLGFTGIAGVAAGIAKIVFVIFLVLFVLSLLFGRLSAV